MTENTSLHQCVCVHCTVPPQIWFGSLVLIFLLHLIEQLWRTIPCMHKHLLSDLVGLSSVQRQSCSHFYFKFSNGHTFQQTEHQLLNESLA